MPLARLRRLRRNEVMRDWIGQTNLRIKNLIMPYFVIDGKGRREPIGSMPGIYRLSVDTLLEDVNKARALGIKAILLFGVSNRKDSVGSQAHSKTGASQKAVKAVKKSIKDIIVMTDICLCGYTSHGHCGIVKMANGKAQNYVIDNDETLKILAKIALSHAEAGADFVAPSAMMDGQVEVIREALDKDGFKEVGILAYSAKYASSFYAPFRDALDSAPQFGDRRSYQMDFRNANEALREIKNDIDEGADIVMVKPALTYLDILRRAKEKFNVPMAAYNVSGEYAMVKAYCKSLETEKNLVLEILTSIKRAGADFIVTYHAKEAAKWLRP